MKKWMKRLVLFSMILGCLAVGGVLGIGYGIYQEVIETTSIEEKVKNIQDKPSYVATEDIDADFLHGIVAVEDHRFYKHGAIDLIGLMRAVMVNLQAGELVQGGSTITQQLAKNMYFSSEQTLERKLGELFVAAELEKLYDKEEILEIYINEIYFGNGCYGIGEASQKFLGKDPSDLSREEAAFLAGLPQSPSRYAVDEVLAKERQQVVLNAMDNNKTSK